MRKKWLSIAAVPAMLMAGTANAAITINPSVPSGTFGNDTVTCTTGTTNCSFLDTITFTTPTGYDSVGASLISGPAQTDAQNLIFGVLTGAALPGVTLNGQMFTLISNGVLDVASLAPIPLQEGATNTLVISGTAGQSGSGSYAGTLTFGNAAVPGVPEAGTWAMMLVGLGGIGWALRRRREQGVGSNLAMA